MRQKLFFLFTICLLLTPPVSTTAQETAPAWDRPASRESFPVPAPASGPSPVAAIVPVDDVTLQPRPEKPAVFQQGLLVETINGETVIEHGPDQGFNPASALKLATALAALRTFGPQHRFITSVWTNGTFDQATGTIAGDLIIAGRDPSFRYEHAVSLARQMNRSGIQIVTGDLIVAPRFTMNFGSSSLRSGELLYDTLDATRRPAAATRAWEEIRQVTGDTENFQVPPSVAVMGAVYVDSIPAGARQLITHQSSPLIDVLKVLLCYSNNFMAERLGDSLGGPQGVRRFLIDTVGIPESEVRLASTSGLGVNRLTPRAMLKIYRALINELAGHRLSASDIMPVAGIDPGTLQKRFESSPLRGSVIAKTGTLFRTDGGISSLVGQLRAQNGQTLLFVIFNQRGSVWRFRDSQDRLLAELQSARGGPAPFSYIPQVLAMRLADTRLAVASPTGADEYEPTGNH